MGRREEIDAEIAKLQAEREALDGVVVIPAEEWQRLRSLVGDEYKRSGDPAACLFFNHLLEEMYKHKPQPRQSGLTQEQGEQVLRWVKHLYNDYSTITPWVQTVGDRLGAMLGHSWDDWHGSEDPRG